MNPALARIDRWVAENRLENKSLSQLRELARAANRRAKADGRSAAEDGIKVADVDAWWDSIDARRIARKPPSQKGKLGYVLTGDPFTYMVDVMFMPDNMASRNDRINEILVFVDVISRYTFAYPIKNHQAEALIEACVQFVKESRDVTALLGDDGFDTAPFKAFWQRLGVRTEFVISKDDHSTLSGHRLGIIDNIVMQLRTKMMSKMKRDGVDRWIDSLARIVEEHNEENDSRALGGRTPAELYERSDRLTMALKTDAERSYNKKIAEGKVQEFSIGDLVHTRTTRGIFDKKTDPWSNDVFRIVGWNGAKYELEGKRKKYDASELKKAPEGAKAVRQPGADAPPAKQKRELRKLR
jgi:hypothetical protein